MKTKALILSVILSMMSLFAHAGKTTSAIAGGVAGYMIGRATSGGDQVGSQPAFVTSNDHNVIACQTYGGRTCQSMACGTYADRAGQECTPGEFAFDSGFRFIHKRSIMFVGERQYIVLEVSK